MEDKYLLSDPSLDSQTTDELLSAVNQDGILPRTRTWAAICRRVKSETHLSEKVIRAITSDEARSARIFGLVTMSHVLIACLWSFGGKAEQEKLQDLVSQWTDDADKETLMWYLRSEGVPITEKGVKRLS